jgi:S1/P1 Nuclease
MFLKKLMWAWLLSLPLCTPAFGWDSAGHMSIAALTYRQLSPALQRKVTQALQSHPDYPKWKASFQRRDAGMDLATFVFMRASTWPDEIRRRGNPYDHPQWHYVDYPLNPPGFAVEPDPAPDNDALYGIAQSEKGLADRSSSPQIRAVYLSWLIHLVGDLHQPLHCASLVNATYPHGDKGGNDFYVKPASRGIKLHAFWDDLLGRSSRPRSRLNYAIRLETEYPRKALPQLDENKSPKAWSLESRQLAVEKAYLAGELKGSSRPQDAPPLPPGYATAAKTVAERQAAVAAYRLADEIRQFVR